MFAFGGAYAVWRFVVEFVRVNKRVAGPFTIYQFISIGMLTACLTAGLFLKPPVSADAVGGRARK
jgi:prolipoprotein diacylglyceryltransferase